MKKSTKHLIAGTVLLCLSLAICIVANILGRNSILDTLFAVAIALTIFNIFESRLASVQEEIDLEIDIVAHSLYKHTSSCDPHSLARFMRTEDPYEITVGETQGSFICGTKAVVFSRLPDSVLPLSSKHAMDYRSQEDPFKRPWE